MTDKSQQLNCPMVELQSWSSSTALSMQRSMDKLEVNTAFVRTGKRCEWIISLGIIVGPMVRIYLTAIVGISHKHKMRLNRPERFRVFHFVIAEDIRYTDVTTTRSKCNRCFFFSEKREKRVATSLSSSTWRRWRAHAREISALVNAKRKSLVIDPHPHRT